MAASWPASSCCEEDDAELKRFRAEAAELLGVKAAGKPGEPKTP